MARQPRREHRRLGAGDGIGMVVADRRGAGSCPEGGGLIGGEPGNGAHPHGRTIAPAAVSRHALRLRPAHEHAAVAPAGVAADVRTQILGKIAARQQRISDRDGAHRIVGEAHAAPEQREILGLDRRRFVNGTDDVARNGTEHPKLPQAFCCACLRAGRRAPTSPSAIPARISARAITTRIPGSSPRNITPMRSAHTGIR